MTINNTTAPSPPPSTYPPTPSPSRTNWTISELATPVPSVMGVATPSRRVLATALRPPLQLSHSSLEFSLPSGYYDLGIQSGAGRAQVGGHVTFQRFKSLQVAVVVRHWKCELDVNSVGRRPSPLCYHCFLALFSGLVFWFVVRLPANLYLCHVFYVSGQVY